MMLLSIGYLLSCGIKTTSTVVVATRSVLVQRDGDVVDTNGISKMLFESVEPDDYYVAVRHRNHLGVMTASPVFLRNTPNTVDFTDLSISTFGTDSSQHIANSRHIMWEGNVFPDNLIKYSGPNNDRDPILVKIGGLIPTNVVLGYYSEDVTMDGVVKVFRIRQ